MKFRYRGDLMMNHDGGYMRANNKKTLATVYLLIAISEYRAREKTACPTIVAAIVTAALLAGEGKKRKGSSPDEANVLVELA